MKKIRLATLLFAASTLLFSSCRKEPANTTCTTSSTTIAGTYKVLAISYKVNSTAGEVDYFKAPYLESCERDDLIIYNTNGTYEYKDAGTVCNPIGTDYGTWAFVGETAMQMDGDDIIIESFDCKTLVIINSNTQVPGDKLKITLARQ